jgi:hypothetical protein
MIEPQIPENVFTAHISGILTYYFPYVNNLSSLGINIYEWHFPYIILLEGSCCTVITQDSKLRRVDEQTATVLEAVCIKCSKVLYSDSHNEWEWLGINFVYVDVSAFISLHIERVSGSRTESNISESCVQILFIFWLHIFARWVRFNP